MSTLTRVLQFVVITLGLVFVLQTASESAVLYEEHFTTNVIGSGGWQPSDGSIVADLDSGWLRISAVQSGYDSHAGKAVSLTLPITIEVRMRLVSGGNNYTQPWLLCYFGPTVYDAIVMGYLPGAPYGWHFGTDNQWTDLHTKGPQSENTWMTIRATIASDGGVLYAKPDTEAEFTTITSRAWSIPTIIDSIEFRQPWNAVCELDYVRVTGPDDNANWCDDFEDYAPNALPFPPWLDGGGNTSGISVDATIAHSGTSSLKMFGQIGNCWGATMAREYSGFPVLISMSVRNGSENLSGCHPQRGMLTLRSGGPHWSNCPCPPVLRFLENGDLEINFPPESPTVITGYALEEWHDVKCYLWLAGDSNLHARIWVNGSLLGDFLLPEEAWMSSPGYLDLSSQEGTAWFDDVCVISTPACAPEIVIDTVTVFVTDTVIVTSNCGMVGDVDCTSAIGVTDVVKIINVAFRGMDASSQFCDPCAQAPASSIVARTPVLTKMEDDK